MLLRSLASFACTVLLAGSTLAQIPSPPETATVSLNGNAITVKYSAPSMRGRKIMGTLVPYGKVWRTGANEATSFATSTTLKVGGTTIPAGTYSIFTLPGEKQWLLILNKQTGQSGLEYHQNQDLARIPMRSGSLSSPQERMSISFENTSGSSTELHVKWENADQSVKITAE